LIASILPLTQTLSPKEMYSLYINVIPKGKYFLKYIKGKSEDKYEQFIVDLLKKEYNCSENQAIDYLKFFIQQEKVESILSMFVKNMV
jgi:hypothetical protein